MDEGEDQSVVMLLLVAFAGLPNSFLCAIGTQTERSRKNVELFGKYCLGIVPSFESSSFFLSKVSRESV